MNSLVSEFHDQLSNLLLDFLLWSCHLQALPELSGIPLAGQMVDPELWDSSSAFCSLALPCFLFPTVHFLLGASCHLMGQLVLFLFCFPTVHDWT